MPITITNPASASNSVRFVLPSRTYRGATSSGERIIDQYYGSKKQARFKQAEAAANARLRSADGQVVAPGESVTLTDPQDVADLTVQLPALESLGLIVDAS